MWMILTQNWRILGIGFLILLTSIPWTLYYREHSTVLELNESIRNAEVLREQAELTNKTFLENLKSSYENEIKKAGDIAVTNFRKRYGNVACTPVSGMLQLPTFSGIQAESAARVDEKPTDSLDAFVRDCGATTKQVVMWQEWAKANGLEAE